MLEFVVSPPRFFSGKKVDKILDPDALKKIQRLLHLVRMNIIIKRRLHIEFLMI